MVTNSQLVVSGKGMTRECIALPNCLDCITAHIYRISRFYYKIIGINKKKKNYGTREYQ